MSPAQPPYPQGRQGPQAALPGRRARGALPAAPAGDDLSQDLTAVGLSGDNEADGMTIPRSPRGGNGPGGPFGGYQPAGAAYQGGTGSASDGQDAGDGGVNRS